MSLLVNVVRVPSVGLLAPGAIVTIPHGLNAPLPTGGDGGLVPCVVQPWSATNIIVNTADASSVTFQNTDASPGFAYFRCLFDHSIQAQAPETPLWWRGIAGSTSPIGPAGGDLALSFPNPEVVGFATKPIDTSAPAANDYWRYDGTTWRHVAVSPGTPAAVWGSFSDAGDQPLSGVPLDLKYGTTDGSAGGVTVAVDPATLRASRITVATAGTYAFTISPQLQHFGGGGAELISFYAVTQAGTVPNSASYLELSNNNRASLPYLELILAMPAGGWLQWWMNGNPGTNIKLAGIAAAAPIPAAPSVIAGCKLIGV